MENERKTKKYSCKQCRVTSVTITVVQTEVHYYSLDLNTAQWESFDGDDSIESQEFFLL